MSYAIWLFVYAAISFLLGFFIRPFRYGKTFKIIFLPGTILWGIAATIACGLTGTKRKKSTYFWAEGPIVSYDESPVKYIGPMILAAAPFILCTAGFATTEFLYGGHGDSAFPYPLESDTYQLVEEGDLSPDALKEVPPKLFAFARSSLTAFGDAPWSVAWTWLYFYLAASFVLSAAPASREKLPLFAALVVLFIPIWLLDYLGFELDAAVFSRGWHLQRMHFVPKCLADLVALSMSLGLVTLVVAGFATLAQRASQKEDPK